MRAIGILCLAILANAGGFAPLSLSEAEARSRIRAGGSLDGVRRLTQPPVDGTQAGPSQSSPANPSQSGKTSGTGATRDVLLVNETGQQIQYFFAVPVTETAWGPDWLGSDVLPVDEEFVVSLPTDTCEYDLRAQFANGQELVRFGLNMCRETELVLTGPSMGPPSRAGVAFVQMRNTTAHTIMTLHAGPAGRGRGPDLLGAAVLPAGGVFTARVPSTAPCLFDITATFDNRRGVEPIALQRQNLCEARSLTLGAATAAAPRAAPASTGQVAVARVRNNTRQVIQFLHTRPAGESRWGTEDHLGDGVLTPGRTHTVRLTGQGCVIDIRGRFGDGTAVVVSAHNVCERPDVTLGP